MALMAIKHSVVDYKPHVNSDIFGHYENKPIQVY